MPLSLFASAPEREPMSSIDIAWLRMDRPGNPMAVTGLMVVRERLDLEHFRAIIAARFLGYKRFRQRPVRRSGGFFWETDPSFELERHVHRTALPGAAGKAELAELVSDLMSTPLDASKPLWQFHLVEDYAGGSAVIARLHHCYADGIALMRVLRAMADADPAATAPASAKPAQAAEGDVWERLFRPAGGRIEDALRWGAELLKEGWATARQPSSAVDYARQGMRLAAEAARIALLPDDSKTRLMGDLGLSKRAAWSEPLPLEEIQAVGTVLGCSVNDLLLAAVAGALRAYLQGHSDPVEGLAIRAVVPVNLRPQANAGALGNRFGLVFLDLPVGIGNPLERLYEVKRRMHELKGSSQPVLALGLLGTLGLGPQGLQDTVLDLLSAKVTAVVTNLPGPQRPLRLAGAEIAELIFWVPQAGRIGLGVSLLSYNGCVRLGLVTDKKRVADPESIVARFGSEFEKLLLLTLMGPRI